MIMVTSAEFEAYLRKGVQHKLAVPKPPKQNDVAERMNWTVVETMRSVLADSKLPPYQLSETPQIHWKFRVKEGTTPDFQGLTPGLETHLGLMDAETVSKRITTVYYVRFWE